MPARCASGGACAWGARRAAKGVWDAGIMGAAGRAADGSKGRLGRLLGPGGCGWTGKAWGVIPRNASRANGSLAPKALFPQALPPMATKWPLPDGPGAIADFGGHGDGRLAPRLGPIPSLVSGVSRHEVACCPVCSIHPRGPDACPADACPAAGPGPGAGAARAGQRGQAGGCPAAGQAGPGPGDCRGADPARAHGHRRGTSGSKRCTRSRAWTPRARWSS